MSVDSDPKRGPESPDSPEAADSPNAPDNSDAPEAADSSDASTVAPDGTELRRQASPAQWEAVGRRALRILLAERQAAVDRAVGEIVATLDYGTPVDETQLRLLRDAIADLEAVAEHDLAGLVED